MKIPKYIREKMHLIAKLNYKARQETNDLEEWLEKHGVDTSIYGLRRDDGCSLVELDDGNDITDELCERLQGIGEF